MARLDGTCASVHSGGLVEAVYPTKKGIQQGTQTENANKNTENKEGMGQETEYVSRPYDGACGAPEL